MLGLSTNVVFDKLPINPGFSPVNQKNWKFKPELSLKIKEEITKQIESPLVEVTQCNTRLGWPMLFWSPKKTGRSGFVSTTEISQSYP